MSKIKIEVNVATRTGATQEKPAVLDLTFNSHHNDFRNDLLTIVKKAQKYGELDYCQNRGYDNESFTIDFGRIEAITPIFKLLNGQKLVKTELGKKPKIGHVFELIEKPTSIKEIASKSKIWLEKGNSL